MSIGDIGPAYQSERWKEQVSRIAQLLRTAESKQQLSRLAMMYVLDSDYSRSAITQAMHDVEIEKGWHS